MKKTAGISLMLLIFLSLCLITFSLLSLSGATADARLAQNSADRTTEYYAAVSTANEILGQIDAQLANALQNVQTENGADDSDTSDYSSLTAYADACSTISVSGVALAWEACGSEDYDSAAVGTLQYDIAVTDDQLLHVALSVVWPKSDSDTLYQITSWQILSTSDWSADTSQNLYRTDTGE
ncbi:MAG: hypothetical protein LIP10_16430 [Clostridiales bacterium]|nr:hypothetical protein [Clostridiales bacterium]